MSIENKCIKCGNVLQSDWNSCPFCGEAVDKKLMCAGCGKELQSAWMKCPFCGEAINQKQSVSATEQSEKTDNESRALESLKKGNDLFQKQLYDGAISAYNEAIQINSSYAKAYNNKGLCYEKKKDWDKALNEYSNAIKADPKFKEAYLNRVYLIINDDYRQFRAELYFKSHDANDPGVFDDYDEQIKKAILDVEKYIEIDPMDWRGYCAQGNAFMEIGSDIDEMAEYFSTAIKVAPDSPYPYFYRAKCYKRHYQYYNKAITDLNKVLELDPNFKAAQKLISEINNSIERSKKKEGSSWLKKILPFNILT